MKKSLASIAWFALVLGLLSCVGAGWFVWDVRSRATLLDERLLTQGGADTQRTSAAARAALRNSKNQRTELAKIIGSRDVVETVRLVEDAAKAAGVVTEVDSVSASGAHPEDKTLETYKVAIGVEGAFPKIVHLISALETLPVPSRIEQVKVEYLERSWQATMLVSLYIEAKP